jgi:hypothetical protein
MSLIFVHLFKTTTEKGSDEKAEKFSYLNTHLYSTEEKEKKS